jgi:hypothetical protein
MIIYTLLAIPQGTRPEGGSSRSNNNNSSTMRGGKSCSTRTAQMGLEEILTTGPGNSLDSISA